MFKIREVTDNNVLGTEMGKLGTHKGERIQYAGQAILIGSQKIGKEQNGRDKAQGYPKIGDDGVLYALSDNDAQCGEQLN